ncbi:MAG: hypothetical protein DSZ28_08770, partial [Thiothrix sp.]
LNCIARFDICCFVETFTPNDFDFGRYCEECCIFHSPAVKLSYHGRRSGGVAILVKKTLSTTVSQILCSLDNTIAIRALDNDHGSIVIICVYIPPVDSPYYHNRETKCNIVLLEEEILRIQQEYPESALLICGDLNARIGGWNVHDEYEDNEDDEDDSCICSQLIGTRQSQDGTNNQFGQHLINLCRVLHLCILNGSMDSDKEGKFTYISQHGNSVIDYCLFHAIAFEHSLQFSVLDEIYSSHMPLTIALNRNQDQISPHPQKRTITKLVWDSSKVEEVKVELQGSSFSLKLARASDMIDSNIDSALQLFSESMLDSVECMRKKICVGGSDKRECPEWFDLECRSAKSKAQKALRKFRKTKTVTDKDTYIDCRNSYKVLVRTKKKEYNSLTCKSLMTSMKDSRSFWSLIKRVTKMKMQYPDISLGEWRKHFEDVFRKCSNPVTSTLSLGDEVVTQFHEELDSQITHSEVKKALQKLRCGKAPGLDLIMGEHLKLSCNYITPFLVKLFQTLFEKQCYPQEWNRSIIVPLFKSGDKLNPANYRGISLLSIVSKLFTSILTDRLQRWSEENNKFSVEQAGFRSDHSTIDHVFTLHSLALKNVYGGGRGKLYVLFVDYRKAFDSVNRTCLWKVLMKLGLSAKFLNMLQAIYSQVQACVRWDSNLSEFFDCPVGVRQGAKESTTLFSLFISMVADYVREHGRHGVQMLPGMLDIFLLIFADDIVLISTTPVGLQCQINNLASISSQLGLSINTEKTKVMVFRRGGFLGRREKWFLNDAELEIVNSYKYLGYVFTTKLSAAVALNEQSTRARKKIVHLLKVMWILRSTNTSIFFHLFDAQILPTLLYGSELWGLNSHDSVEKAHLIACKRFLNLDIRTPNCMIYGDLGRYPIIVNSTVRSIKYWLKLSSLSQDRLPKQAYGMLMNTKLPGELNWASSVKNCLCKLGFAYVWENGGVQNKNVFLSCLKQRIRDCYHQEWHSKLESSERFRMYSSFKNVFKHEQYLHGISIKKFRDVFVRFRFGINELMTNRVHVRDKRDDLSCPFCRGEIENENHFLLHCKTYDDIRRTYLKNYAERARRIGCSLLIDGQEVDKTRKVAMYIYYAIRRRDFLMNVPPPIAV